MTIADFAPKENRRLSVWSGFKLPMPDFGLSTKVETNFGLSPKVETAKKSADSLPTPDLSPFIESPSPVRRISHVSSRRKRVQFQPICEEEEVQEPNNEVFCDTNTLNTLELDNLKQE